MSAERLSRIDAVVEEELATRHIPGAVVLIARHGKVVFRKAYGFRALEPKPEPMTVDTVFDLASLTKVVATATAVLTLVEEGRLRLSDPVAEYLPDFASGSGERGRVTIEDLLIHRAGFPPDDPIALYTGRPDEIFAKKYRQPLATVPGAAFVYSDVGYEVLGELVHKVSERTLADYCGTRVFARLGMKDTEFRPAGKGRLSVSRIAPTQFEDGVLLRGLVHDPRARVLGGVAGHAGLFSTADDLARFASSILGTSRGTEGALSPAGVAAMTSPRFAGDRDLRGLGWDIATRFSTPRGDLLPLGSFGHTGFTGTSLWLDPTSDLFVILLTSRLHPRGETAPGEPKTGPLRGKLANIAAAAIVDVQAGNLRQAWATTADLLATASVAEGTRTASGRAEPEPEFSVRAGIDVLESDGFAQVAGKRIGLLTNQTGQARDGRTTLEVLLSERARATKVTVMRLFSPEHGPKGALDESVADARDEKTGLPIRSLYRPEAGANARRPAPEDLAGLDAVVVDLQDAGCRFYTYLTTLGYLMEEAARANVEVVVLDRPNPIGAVSFEGPLADASRLSFTAYHTIPVRTGLTIGELANLFNAEKKLGTRLTVVKMGGYRRALWYDETGLAWVHPSPNLRSVTQAALYPGVALLETTNVSVGRGTDAPFEIVGAPWMDGPRLAETLNRRRIPGVRFSPIRFTPTGSTHEGQLCQGVRITCVDRRKLSAVRLGLEIATALRDRFGTAWDRKAFGKLVANDDTLSRFERGESAGEIAESWEAGHRAWAARREPFLLYRP